LIDEAVEQRAHFLDATRIATALMGDTIATNLFMLGFAFQKGLIPLGEASLLHAIELNGVAVASNKQTFLWGRRAASDLQAVERVAAPVQPVIVNMPETLDRLVARRVDFLTSYQNAAYGRRYKNVVEQVRAAESKIGKGDTLARAVAKSLFKLMAYKDEYEVARLYSDRSFEERLRNTFEGGFSIKYNLAPPLLAKRDADGFLVKSEYGAWMKYAFRFLARMKWLRHTALDPFGYTGERKAERRLIRDYQNTIEQCLMLLSADNHDLAVELASLPGQVRGFGHIKDRNIAAYYRNREALLDRLNDSRTARAA